MRSVYGRRAESNTIRTRRIPTTLESCLRKPNEEEKKRRKRTDTSARLTRKSTFRIVRFTCHDKSESEHRLGKLTRCTLRCIPLNHQWSFEDKYAQKRDRWIKSTRNGRSITDNHKPASHAVKQRVGIKRAGAHKLCRKLQHDPNACIEKWSD